MILIISILFTLFLVTLIAYNKLSSLSVRFLCGTFTCWCISIVCLLLFLSKQSYYWGAVNRIFYITPFMWDFLLKYVPAGADSFIRGMNFGVTGIYYCSLCYSIAFTSRNRRECKRIFYMLLPASVLQMVIYDPFVQKGLQNLVSTGKYLDFHQYTVVFDWVRRGFQVLNAGYCLVVVLLMGRYLFAYTKIRFLRRYTVFNMSCILPVTFLFLYTFRWYPKILVKSTMKKGYYNYLIPDLQAELLNSGWFYALLTVIYGILLVYLFKYKSIEDYYKKDKQKITISMDTASLGINTFTHAMKNHVQGIKSEAEYLAKTYPETEIQDSTGCILDACQMCFASIENANKLMGVQKLDMKLIPFERIIENAITAIGPEKASIVELRNVSETYMAYMDENAMTEVLVNLIGNALEAVEGKEGGRVRISVNARGKWNSIEVEDNGRGIPQENLSKIFTPFFSTKSTIHNWGIGLAYCYKVITAHDGRIVVDSEEGKGSVFAIVLPFL